MNDNPPPVARALDDGRAIEAPREVAAHRPGDGPVRRPAAGAHAITPPAEQAPAAAQSARRVADGAAREKAEPLAQPPRRPRFLRPPAPAWRQDLAWRTAAYSGPLATLRRTFSLAGVGSVFWPIALLIALPALAFRLYAVDGLPGEFYGDIAIIYEYVNEVLKGHWPFSFVLSTGPFYGYAIAPLIALFGQQGYLPYKLASIVVSLVGILFTSLLARQIAGFRAALLTGFILATATWYLVFSRLGNAQIIVPVIAVASFYLLARAINTNNLFIAMLGGAVSALGLYTMPQAFVIPLAYLIVSAFYLPRKKVGALCLAVVVAAIPFAFIVAHNLDLFFSRSGYIGGKIGSGGLGATALKVLDNAKNTLLMLHVRGDGLFRSNASWQPQLDPVSGVLFLLGLMYWISGPRRRWLPLLLVPLFLLPVPSILVTNETPATPSASRTIGMLPFVAVLVGSGACLVWEWLDSQGWLGRRLAPIGRRTGAGKEWAWLGRRWAWVGKQWARVSDRLHAVGRRLTPGSGRRPTWVDDWRSRIGSRPGWVSDWRSRIGSRDGAGDRRLLQRAVLVVVLGSIVVLNWNRYFYSYADGLPNHNTPIGKLIAQEIDRLPPGVGAYVVGCCWGDWAQPEPKGIMYVVNPPRAIQFLPQDGFQCGEIAKGVGVYVVFPPSMGPQLKRATACLGSGRTVTHTSPYGDVIFYSFAGGAALAATPSGAAAPAPSAVPTAPVEPTPALPASFSCVAGGRSVAAGARQHAAPVRLEALRAMCGCPTSVTSRHPARWHGQTLARGLQLAGNCPIAVYRLDRQYDEIAGTIYVDDHTGTSGGVIYLYNAAVPTNPGSYRPVFSNNIGYVKERRVSFTADVRGVEYLAVWERCCTAQNTIFDVVAALRPLAGPVGQRHAAAGSGHAAPTTRRAAPGNKG